MIKFVRNILGLCNHHWTIVATQRTVDNFIDCDILKYKHVIQCVHCGKIEVK